MEDGIRAAAWVMRITSDSLRNEPYMDVISVSFIPVEWCFFSVASLSKFHLRYKSELASDVPSDVVALLSF